MTSPEPYSVRRMFSHGLGRKFLLIVVFGATATTACSALFGYYLANKLRRDGTGTAMQWGAGQLAGQIEISLDAAVGLMKHISTSPRLQQAIDENNKEYENLPGADIRSLVRNEKAMWEVSGQPQEQLDALRRNEVGVMLAEFAEANPAFRTLIAVDRGGKAVGVFGKVDSPYSGQEKRWTRTGITGRGKAATGWPIFSGARVSASVPICVPVRPAEGANYGGELYAEYALDQIISHPSEEGQEIVAFLLTGESKRHLYILSPAHMASAQATGFGAQGNNPPLEKRGHFLMELNQFGVKTLAGFAPVRHLPASASARRTDGNWFVIMATPEGHAMAPVNSLFLRALGLAAVMLVLVSLVALVLSRQILKPIRMLQSGVQEIGQGNLEHRIDVRSGDEMETLAFEFHRMAERMQRTQEQLQRRGKELEQRVNQLRRLQAQFMQSERMAATGELAAQIAHEINNPLGIIKNYVGIARMLMADEDPNRENLRIVDQEINRTAGIVRRLLKFARPSTEDIQSVQINQVLEELLALLRGQLFRAKIEVSTKLAENLPEVSVSTDQMRQVFLNLIKNAEDAMHEGGTLDVRTQYRKGRVEVTISDTGCGIPPEDVKNIFEPFFTTKGVKGTGLGLSVSYGIVKNYNGEISVESEPGIGTTFTIQLPVVSDKVFQVIQSS